MSLLRRPMTGSAIRRSQSAVAAGIGADGRVDLAYRLRPIWPRKPEQPMSTCTAKAGMPGISIGMAGIFGKMMEMTRSAFAKAGFLVFGISLAASELAAELGYVSKPTYVKTRKNMPFKTSTTQNPFSFRINDMPQRGRLGPKLECPLKPTKRLQKRLAESEECPKLESLLQ